MDTYKLLEREFIENQLINELNASSKHTGKNNKKKQTYSRPNINIGTTVCKELFSLGRNTSSRKAKSFIITKSNKKRIYSTN